MSQNFIECDREQLLLMSPSLREWLPENHLAWFVIDAVKDIDLSPFYARYREDGWDKEQMESVINHGIQVLIPPDAAKRKGTRPGWDGGAYSHMRRVLSTELGRALYRKRQAMIEPVFGHTKFNRRIDRFQRRGRAAARSEWRLITATHNLLKLHSHQIAAAGA